MKRSHTTNQLNIGFDASTGQQVRAIMHIVEGLSQALHAENKSDLEPHESPTMAERLDARMALEGSLVRTCNRLDQVLGDDAYWCNPDDSILGKQARRALGLQQKANEEAIKASRKAQEAHDAAAMAAKMETLPHKAYRPTFSREGPAHVLTYKNGDVVIQGRGPTWADAINDYNRQFFIPAEE